MNLQLSLQKLRTALTKTFPSKNSKINKGETKTQVAVKEMTLTLTLGKKISIEIRVMKVRRGEPMKNRMRGTT